MAEGTEVSIASPEPIKWVGTKSPATHRYVPLGPLVERDPLLGQPGKVPKWSVGAILPSAADATHVAFYAGANTIYASLEPGANDGIREDSGFRQWTSEPTDKSEAELLAELLEAIAVDIRALLALKQPVLADGVSTKEVSL